jgi:protease IV
MGKIFKKLFRTLSIIQKIFFGIIFWGIVLVVIISLFYKGTPKVREGEVLVAVPTGYVVDEYSQSSYERELADYMGNARQETLLSDLQWVFEEAGKDQRINSILLDLSGFAGGGPAVLEELLQSLKKYKESGKSLYVYAPSLNQSSLLLSTAADEVVIDPMGEVFIKGYGSYRSYMKEGLDKWGITPHVYRAGEDKDYVAPYLSSSMTARERATLRNWLDDLWDSWMSETAYGLDLEPALLKNYINRYGTLLAQNEFSPAELALEAGLVDKLMSYDDFNQLMISRVGLDESGAGFSQSYWTDYMSREYHSHNLVTGQKVALLKLSGEILWGEGDFSRIGSYQVEQILDTILADPDVVAFVLRIDSPGGSAMGAEMIRRKLEKFHDFGIPFYVSMGNTAASGGYWIACEADEIWAENTTITGSIGVFSYFFTAEDFLKEKGGITVDGYGTTAVADLNSMGRDTSEETDKMLQANVDGIYRQFLSLVSHNRGITSSVLETLAGGKVWTGRQALDNGLVDHIGGLVDVLDQAADEAALGADYNVALYDDSEFIQDSPAKSLIPTLHALFSLPPLVQEVVPFINLPQDNPFGDPRGINAWSSYEVIQ